MPIGWVREQLEQVLDGVQHSPWHDAQPGRAAARVAALEVAACSGEAHQWIVRGRRRANFELQIELKWRVALDGVDVAGTAKCGPRWCMHVFPSCPCMAWPGLAWRDAAPAVPP